LLNCDRHTRNTIRKAGRFLRMAMMEEEKMRLFPRKPTRKSRKSLFHVYCPYVGVTLITNLIYSRKHQNYTRILIPRWIVGLGTGLPERCSSWESSVQASVSGSGCKGG